MGTFKQGTYIEKRMFESRAFLALRGSAPQLLILFLGRRSFDRVGKKQNKKYECTNSDSISFTYIEAQKKYGFSKHTFRRAIDDLLAKGFIEVKHSGGAYKRDKSLYALSVKWTFWNPGTVFECRKRDPVQRGFRRPIRNADEGLQNVAL
jgi:hypothetical protein